MNSSEKFVSTLCENSFFSLWSYPNPRGKKDKELCDVLVVFDPYVIVISVKEIKFTECGDFETSVKRWQKKAIDESVSQIYGAVKWIINKSQTVIQNDGSYAISIPSNKKIIRIGVALGGEGKAPIFYRDFGKGFVHIFDEISFHKLMSELDTITDFIEYLVRKEDFISKEESLFIEGGEEDLLAYYLTNNRCFPDNVGKLIISSGVWDEFEHSKAYSNRKREDEISYAWDYLIKSLCKWFQNGELLTKHNIDEYESAIRTMAKENRFDRRLLSKSFGGMLYNKIRARVFPSNSGVTYVFQANDPSMDRDDRKAELEMRCIIARGLPPQNKVVIGIATEMNESPEEQVSYDLLHYTLDDWNPEMQELSDKIQREMGYFKDMSKKEFSEYEYPQGNL